MGWEISRLVASGWQAMDVRIRQRMLDAADIGRPDFSKARLLAELNQAHTVHRTVGSIVRPCLRPTGCRQESHTCWSQVPQHQEDLSSFRHRSISLVVSI